MIRKFVCVSLVGEMQMHLIHWVIIGVAATRGKNKSQRAASKCWKAHIDESKLIILAGYMQGPENQKDLRDSKIHQTVSHIHPMATQL
jgi:hypothetical protein